MMKSPIPDLIFQDQDILVIQKPPHLLSIPDGYDATLPHLKSVLEPDHGALWMVHRLDKDTSGVMVLARNAEAHRALNTAFRNHDVRKQYHGLVSPVPDWREQVIELPLAVNADRKHRTRVDQHNGKPSWTSCQVMKRFPLGVLMSIEIRTGITHQIRAHLRANDLALLGDTLYQAGLDPQTIPAPRVMLHAREIHFPHPRTGESLNFSAPYPDDFRAAYTELAATRDQDIVI